ncbi:hypothetical protein [Sphingobacterium sp. UDSM-2020]|uniref:hypothetical protein n=1 Tax=Sphingobacterium sp. UDSM-2020 TaxID=2795738 RepID=UPI001938DF5C|nr:hypothetical protein [Sphingobacterium sp. UDSM-2020]QQD11635.1 hypothetical protein JAZ75_13440 [Sphingobacterium sp. UDSM-2020]
MMKTTAFILYSHLFIFALMLTALWVANLLWSGEDIPFVQIIIAAGLYFGYSYMISNLILRFWGGARKQRVISVICYLILFITVIPIVQILIHDVLPLVGIIFFDDSLPENMPKFYFRIVSGYLIANLLAMIVAIGNRYFTVKKEKKKLDQDLRIYRDRVVGFQYTSHFLTSIFLTKFGEMLLNDVPKDKTTKRDIVQFLAYLLEVERPGDRKSWAEEMDQLHCFIRLLSRHYGEKAILYTETLHDRLYPAIPAGILFFPLENCLKHAHISTDQPIEFRLDGNHDEIVLTCQNYWSPKDERLEPETGFEMLRYKLGQMDTETAIAIKRTENTFLVRLRLKLQPDEKAKL